MSRRLFCPTGCGSTSFAALRRGVLRQEFTVEADGTIEAGEMMAEGGGRTRINCSECGHSWETGRDLDLARFMEGR